MEKIGEFGQTTQLRWQRDEEKIGGALLLDKTWQMEPEGAEQ